MRILIFIIIFAGISLAQELNVDKYEYLAPLHGSKNVNPYNNIIIREGSILEESDAFFENILEVIGSKSGVHRGETLLLENSKTILFKPLKKFYENEVVTIELNYEKSNNQVNILPQLVFNFTTGKDNSKIAVTEFCDLVDNENPELDADIDVSSSLVFPNLSVMTNNNPSDDYLFLGLSSGGTGHLLIVDNDLIPVFYRKVQGNIFDFKYQVNNELTYNIYPVYSYGIDNSGKQTRQFHTPTGYALDIHDLQVMEDKSYYILGREFLTIDMSQYVPNGDTAAILHANTIHHMDADNNEVWRWRAIDHYDILDVDEYVDLNQHSIDWTHCNALEIDYDGNILISTRNFNEITKIDRRTGDIVWRFGGERNQFRIHKDVRGFSRQHDVQRLSNGNIVFFDNGNYLIPQFSSYIEYDLDETNYSATLVRQYSRNQSIHTNSKGSIQELDNGNTLISWGRNVAPCITEINKEDSIEFEINFHTYTHQYRAYRFDWETDYFSVRPDTIDFGWVSIGDSSSQSVELYNSNQEEVIINEVLHSSANFIVKDNLPIIIPPQEENSLSVMFKPDARGYFENKLNIRYASDTLLLGQQITLLGISDHVTTKETRYSSLSFSLSQNYPNPFNPSTVVNFSIPHNEFVTIEIYSALGARILSLVSKEFETGQHSIEFVREDLASGIYFYKMVAGEFTDTKKLIILK